MSATTAARQLDRPSCLRTIRRFSGTKILAEVGVSVTSRQSVRSAELELKQSSTAASEKNNSKAVSRWSQRRTDQYGNIGRAPCLKSGDLRRRRRRRGGRPGRVEEERRRLGGGRPGRRRLTPGRTTGEGSGEREDGGGRRLRSDGQQRDAS
jgi:hypothetical protein